MPGLSKEEGYYMAWNGVGMNSTPGAVYCFPALEECRKAFAKLLQQNVTWGDKDAWSIEPVPDPKKSLF